MFEYSEHATINDEESLTELEHADSCDINRMVRQAARGVAVRGSGDVARFNMPDGDNLVGEADDMSMDRIRHEIRKAEVEKNLTAMKDSLTEEELVHVPKSIKEKFGFKAKSKKVASDDGREGDSSKMGADAPKGGSVEGDSRDDSRAQGSVSSAGDVGAAKASKV